jgi:hypothetical protein
MKYIQIIDGQFFGEPTDVPRSFRNVSNFHLLSDEQLKDCGWYPVRLVENANKTTTTLVTGYDFVIEGDEVVQYEQIREKTSEEIQTEKNEKWKQIRMQRGRLLQSSDWTQLSDSPLTEEKKEEWQIYRQSLRDITTQTDPFDIIWPNKPE